MNYNHPKRNNSAVIIRMMCAIVFMIFSFLWLFCFQADMLAMMQHVMSGGMTSYNPVLGAVIITGILQLLQLIVYSLLKLRKRSHALTYVPSMLLLAMLTDIDILPDGSIHHTTSLWVPILVMLIWLAVVFVARQLQELEEDDDYGLLSRPMWVNMLLMSLMIILVAWLGNTNAVFNYRMQMERLMSEGNYARALKVGDESLEGDASLLMLRMYALARQDALGERLFHYPITGNVSEILPTNGGSQMLLCPVDSLYRFLGGRPAAPMEPMRFLQLLIHRDSVPSKAVSDYMLCGLLIDRQIDRFAEEIVKYYRIDEHLPKHYREALTLYTHLRSNPILIYKSPVIEEDYSNLQELESHYPNELQRKGKVLEQYFGTYWYYYEYE